MAEKNMSTFCFKAYDICGRVYDELNEKFANRLGLCFLPSSEINRHLEDPQAAISMVEKHFTETG